MSVEINKGTLQVASSTIDGILISKATLQVSSSAPGEGMEITKASLQVVSSAIEVSRRGFSNVN